MELTRVKLKVLRELQFKAPGILDAFLQRGEIHGDCVTVTREVFEELNGRFFKGELVGSKLHGILAPVVKVVDKVLGTNLGGCSGCAGRELKLNAVTGIQGSGRGD